MAKSSKRGRNTSQRSLNSFKTTSSPLVKTMFPKKGVSYNSDSILISRINQYLAEHKDKIYVDVNDMVSELQSHYREYARRKRNAFKPLVEKAFSSLLEQCNPGRGDMKQEVDDEEDEEEEEEGEEEEDSDGSSEESSSEEDSQCKAHTSANSQIMDLYNTPGQSKSVKEEPEEEQEESNSNSNDSSTELIELSSGDESKKKEPPRDPFYNVERITDLEGRILDKNAIFALGSSAPKRKSGFTPNLLMPNKPETEVAPKGIQKSLKRKKDFFDYDPDSTKKVTFSDFGGNEKVLEEVCKLIIHITHPEIYREIGISSPRGFLLHGPPGCGKTLLARAIAGELEIEMLQVSAPELIGGVSGESEERIRDLFQRAVICAPCVLFIDEVDAITPNRENAQKEMERRVVAQLLTCLDDLNTKPNGELVLVIGATNRPDSLDPALRRAGRFDREVCLGIPDLKAREKILRVLCSNMNLSKSFSFEELAQNTPGFVGADLLALTREAAMVALNRLLGALEIYRNQDHKNKRRKIEKETRSRDEPEEISLESSQSTEDSMVQNDVMMDPNEEALVRSEMMMCQNEDAMSQSEMMMQQNEEAISQNFANEHSLNFRSNNFEEDSIDPIGRVVIEGRNGYPPHVITEASLGLSPRRTLEERAVNENITNELMEQIKIATSGDEPLFEDVGNEVEVSREEPEEVINEEDSSELYVEIIKERHSPSLDTLLSWLRDTTPLTCRQLRNICITQEDFKLALSSVQPSAKREGFATVPDVTWEDVGSLSDVREELKMSILGPVKFRKQFESLGLRGPAGILICGPPGCGKTLLAKAVANEAGINFISVKGPELLNMYVGESERAVRRCFQRARNSAPCVIFFDELDALCPRRSDSAENGASKRVVNQLLTEMDGVEDRKEVYLMAATNRPDIVDPAVLRPGRLDKVIYVGLPQAEDRVDILRALTKNGTRPRLSDDVNLAEIALRPQCNGYSGADLAALVREAGVQAVKDFMAHSDDQLQNPVTVSLEHFERALRKVRPSVSAEDRVYYEIMKKKYEITTT